MWMQLHRLPAAYGICLYTPGPPSTTSKEDTWSRVNPSSPTPSPEGAQVIIAVSHIGMAGTGPFQVQGFAFRVWGLGFVV